ncbi:MAG: type IX secretion system sortase PorU [Flavobacteriales bacterium]|nr:type IX secretion system sortase PorU [Flavobacteriales bacterium]
MAKDGVYKVSYEMLRDMGAEVAGLASDRINVYGNHFGMLPFQNNVDRPTDVIPNAIEVVDGGDGVFNAGDYLLFFASGAQRWAMGDSLFAHSKNVFTDSASYFIGIDADPPKRIGPAVLTTDPVSHTVTNFRDRQVIDRDLVNLIKSGRTWYSDVFDLTLTYTYNFETPFLVPSVPLVLEVDGAARTFNAGATVNYSSFSVSSTGGLSSSFQVQGIANSYTGPQGRNFHHIAQWSTGGNNVPVTVTFNKFDPVTSVAWLNYLRLNCTRELRMTGDQLAFRDPVSAGTGNVAEFVLDQAQNAQRIWEITDPTNVRRIDYTVNGSQKLFRLHADSLRQFIAFRDANYLTPVKIGRVQNQDLHATTVPTDLVIVCYDEYLGQAQRLAERRASEGLSVRIVTPQQVFNEFSSGARDATAIKRYMRMLYDRASAPEEMPRYLLLFGDGSYNNVVLTFGNQSRIPTYQTEDAIDPSRSYTSDDYFGLLDAGEGEYTGDLVDIGVGRLIAHTGQQARELVDKLLGYDALQLLSASGNNCSTTGDGGIADWRTHVLFVSDDQEGDGFEGTIHMEQSDFLATIVETEHPELNVEKLYMDAYQQLSTPGGERYPDAIDELREKVQKGQLLVNYVGHGGEVGWAHERLLDNNTILGWTNKDRLPLFMTATCEFSRWDDPARTSAGELVLLNPDGGGIGLMSTTRLAYSSQNFALAQDFYDFVFENTDELGREARLGDTYRRMKVAIATVQPTLRNHRNFSLLGDPSMRLGRPRGTLRITAITDTLGNPLDTLKALATVRIEGYVDDGNGEPMTGFDGVVVPTVYDKKQVQYTLANDGGAPFDFEIRKNIIYRGKATVNDGVFKFTFVVPKDINYQVGPGRVSCYAESSSLNASGYSNDPLIGSTATDVVLDDQGPRIDLFLNDDRFVRGGMTNEDPLLFAKIFDENGINTVGSSIGHDLLATLDENSEQAVVLNDLYEADLDTYKSGQVRYRFDGLAEGTHTLRLKAWDAHNNSSESTTDFVVAPSAELALDHVLNYPNPFTTYTEFYFEHNRPCASLNVQVQVFTVAGRLVKTLNRQLNCEGFRTEPMEWDGRDDFGDKLGRGAYVYRLHVSTTEGEDAEKFEKLVILR